MIFVYESGLSSYMKAIRVRIRKCLVFVYESDLSSYTKNIKFVDNVLRNSNDCEKET